MSQGGRKGFIENIIQNIREGFNKDEKIKVCIQFLATKFHVATILHTFLYDWLNGVTHFSSGKPQSVQRAD